MQRQEQLTQIWSLTYEEEGHVAWPEDIQSHGIVQFAIELTYQVFQTFHFLKR